MIEPTITVHCARCRQPVDNQEIWRDDASMRYIVKVFCHGDKDESSLYDMDLAHGWRIVKAEAFA